MTFLCCLGCRSDGQDRGLRRDGEPVHGVSLKDDLSTPGAQSERVLRLSPHRRLPHLPRHGLQLPLARTRLRTHAARHILLVHEPGAVEIASLTNNNL